ncbi:hypothetical protein AVEN_163416-1, partial [Araneus ventricosus]
ENVTSYGIRTAVNSYKFKRWQTTLHKHLINSHDQGRIINPLTPRTAVTAHASPILVGRISAGCRSEWGEKAVGGVVIKGPLWVEIGDERPAFHISHQPEEKMKRDGQIHFTDQLVNKLRSGESRGEGYRATAPPDPSQNS